MHAHSEMAQLHSLALHCRETSQESAQSPEFGRAERLLSHFADVCLGHGPAGQHRNLSDSCEITAGSQPSVIKRQLSGRTVVALVG